VLRLWPLIIVISGLFQIFRPGGDVWIKRAAEGVGSIAVGLVLLGNTFGFIPWTVWLTMLSLWPLLLVGLGIELLGRGLHLNWLRALSNVFLTLGLLYGVFVLGPGWTGGGLPVFGVSAPASANYSMSAPHEAALTEGDAAIKVGAVRLTVAGGDQRATCSGRAGSGQEPGWRTGTVAGAASVTITDPTGRVVYLPSVDRNLDVTLDRGVVWRNLRLDVGAVQADADLSELAVKALDVNVGASEMKLRIGSNAKDVKVAISGGATSVTLFVPANAEVTLDARSGLSSVSVPASFRRLSGFPGFGQSTWKSDGSGGPRIAVAMNSGVTNLIVETY